MTFKDTGCIDKNITEGHLSFNFPNRAIFSSNSGEMKGFA
jgi:hypothetical protein